MGKIKKILKCSAIGSLHPWVRGHKASNDKSLINKELIKLFISSIK